MELVFRAPPVYCRPFLDFKSYISANEIRFFTDASGNFKLGMGGVCERSWFTKMWDSDFMKTYNPSIEYLELYALVTGILLWIHRYRNKRVVIFCDNISVVYMVNKSTSICKTTWYSLEYLP